MVLTGRAGTIQTSGTATGRCGESSGICMKGESAPQCLPAGRDRSRPVQRRAISLLFGTCCRPSVRWRGSECPPIWMVFRCFPLCWGKNSRRTITSTGSLGRGVVGRQFVKEISRRFVVTFKRTRMPQSNCMTCRMISEKKTIWRRVIPAKLPK